MENPWYAIDFNTRKGTIRKLYDKDLNKQLVTPDAEWEMGEFIYEIIDSRHPMEQYRAPQFLRCRPEKMRFEKYEKGDVWDTYRFRGETVAGREPNNLMVEFRVFNVTKKIEVVYRLRKQIRKRFISLSRLRLKVERSIWMYPVDRSRRV